MAKRGLGSPKVSKAKRREIAKMGGQASHGGGRQSSEVYFQDIGNEDRSDLNKEDKTEDM